MFAVVAFYEDKQFHLFIVTVRTKNSVSHKNVYLLFWRYGLHVV